MKVIKITPMTKEERLNHLAKIWKKYAERKSKDFPEIKIIKLSKNT